MVQTFDWPFNHWWLNEVHKICPQTQEVLSHSILTPNYVLQNMISQCCNDHGLELPNLVWDIDDKQLTQGHRLSLHTLLYKLWLSLSPNKKRVFAEDLITTLVNLSIHDDNKTVIKEDGKLISLLIELLKSEE